MNICSEQDCDHRVKAHGLCERHYVRPGRHRTCEGCGRSFVATSGKPQRFCDLACWTTNKPKTVPALRVSQAKPRYCTHCEREFHLTGTRRSYFCSVVCEQAHPAGLEAARVAAKAQCAEDGCPKAACKRGFCGAHYQKRCRPNRSHGAVGIVEWKRLNPERAAISDKNKDHRRRAKLHNAPSEPIDRRLVGERDGWRCGICRRKVDPALRAPHPKSQSLDHIEPLSRGGAHTYANVRIAHLKCNVDRSSRFDHEQLALFG